MFSIYYIALESNQVCLWLPYVLNTTYSFPFCCGRRGSGLYWRDDVCSAVYRYYFCTKCTNTQYLLRRRTFVSWVILIGCAKTDGPITGNITGSFCICLLANTAWPSYVVLHDRLAINIQASVALIKFFVCFGFVAIFLGLVLGGGGDRGGSFFSSMTIFSAARFFDSFLLLPSPSVVSSAHRQHVTYVRICAGPDSFTSCSQINRDREHSLTFHLTQLAGCLINAQPLLAHRPAADDWQMIGRCPVPQAMPVPILLTAYAHYGDRLGAFFYWSRVLKTMYRLTIPLRFIWSICSGN